MSSTVNSPKQDLVSHLFLRALAAEGIREAEVGPLHRAFRALVTTLHSLKGRNPSLYSIRFNFEPGDGRFVELDRAIKDLKAKEVLDIVWLDSETIYFFPNDEHRNRDTAALIEGEIRKARDDLVNPTDRAFLSDLCRQAAKAYKSLRRSSCD